jgi:O-antigen/teichoic acid export membrane protein
VHPPQEGAQGGTGQGGTGQGGTGRSKSTGQSLTALTVKGFAWAFTGTIAQALLQTISMVALARLLKPAEFGAAQAAGLVIGLSQVVSQLGVGPALVQRKTLNDREVTAAFYSSLLLSGVLAALLVVVAPWVNPLLSLPRESTLLPLLTIALVCAGAAAAPMGVLQRQLRFREMAVIDVLAFGPATIGVSVVLALLHVGPASLIWGQIAGGLTTAIGYHLRARVKLRPESPIAMARTVRPLLGFGAWYSVSQLGNWSALNADNFVAVNVLGTGPFGVYSRAYNLLAQPANVIGTAVDKALFPAMAKAKDDGERLRRAYVRSASLVALITVPLSLVIWVLAPEIVGILLGKDWQGVVVPLQILALVLLPRASYKISGSLTRATGAVSGGAWRQWLYAGEVFVGCAIGTRWGINGVAVGASVAIVLHFLIMLRFSERVARGLMRSVLVMYAKHVPIGLVSFAAAYGVALAVRPVGWMILTVVAVGAAWAVATAGTVVLLRRFFGDEVDVVRSVVRPRRSDAKAA